MGMVDISARQTPLDVLLVSIAKKIPISKRYRIPHRFLDR